MRTSTRFLASAVRIPLIAVLCILGALAACEEAGGPGEDFIVRPDTASIFVGNSIQLTAVGAGGQVSWSSSNSQVATVVPQTGFVTAVSRGQATISAVSGSTVATAEITVLVPPSLALSSATIAFERTVGAASPPQQTVNVTNAGDGQITNITVGPVQYTAGQPADWLTANAAGSTAPLTVTLAASGAGLPRGTYTAIVPVRAEGIDNSPQNIAVTYRVLAPASIVLSESNVQMATTPGGVVQEQVDITNGGDRPLTGLTAAITYTGGQGWLSAGFSQPAAPSTLTLTANAAGLGSGTYNATVRVSSNVAGVTPRDIAVQLTVGPGPAIALSTATLNISAVSGSNPSAATINVTNGGGATLTGLTLGPVAYAQGQTGGWLNPVLNGTTAPTTITVGIASAQLPNGTYNATFQVRSNVASNSPVTVTVNLTVAPAASIVLSHTDVQFATWSGGTLPGSQVILITNGGGGTLTGLQGSINYTSAQNAWLGGTIDTSAPGNLTLRPTRTNLPVGTHTATVTVSSTMPGVASRTVNVTYVIQSFSVHLYPVFVNARNPSNQSCAGCHGVTAPTWSGTASTYCNNLQGYVNPGSPATSTLVAEIFGGAGHSGGKFNNVAGFSGLVNSWIISGAPCS
jgi:hypothetical protein